MSASTIQVYPGASLFKPKEQWNAMVNGQLDISPFPLDYASGKVPAFGATLMPGLIRNQERAKRLNKSQFMKDIHAEIEKHGVMVLADAWLAGAVASKDELHHQAGRHQGPQDPLRRPDLRGDVAGAGAIDRQPAVERNLQRAADRRAQRHRHQPRQLRLHPALRSQPSA